MAFVSIILPVYNCEKYITRCVDSILNQTFNNFELIIVNDGSTDNTLKLIEKYSDSRIRIINEENKGVSFARNTALDYIKNKDCESLITFIDSDDYVDTDYLDYLVGKITSEKVDICCCSYCYQFLNKSKAHRQIKNDCILTNFTATNKIIEDKTIQSHSCCKIFKKHLWNSIRFPNELSWMEDQATIFKIFYNSKNGIYVSNYCGYHYWQEGDSACRGKMSNKRVIDSIKGYLEALNFNFSNYNLNEQAIIKKSALNAFAETYLMMIPRLKRKELIIEQRQFLKTLRVFVHKNNIILKFEPKNKKSKLKKYCYLFAKPLYKILYKLFS